jgi:hypothetical protein
LADIKRNSARSLPDQTELTQNNLVSSENHSDLGGRTLWVSTMALLWPWKRWDYKGRLKHASEAAGYSVKSIDRWRYPGCFGVPPAAARRLIALLKWEIQARQQLLDAWLAYEKTADLKANAAKEFAKNKAKRDLFS